MNRPNKIYILLETIELTASSLQAASYKIEQELQIQITGHAPIRAAMPFLYLPDRAMSSVVFLEPIFTIQLMDYYLSACACARARECECAHACACREKERGRTTCLPARARRMNFFSTGGA